MDLQRMVIKLPARPGTIPPAASLIPIFHSWIQTDKLDETLIDVADYEHVPSGPGIMLISHEINFAIDHGVGGPGLLAQRKHAVDGDAVGRVVSLVRSTLAAAVLLEQDARSAELSFDAGHVLWQSNDRLRAANDDAGWAAVEPALAQVAQVLYPGSGTVERVELDGRERLTARLAGEATDAATLLARLSG